MPVTTGQMEQMGISRQLVHRYVLNGWLESLGYGYFMRVVMSLPGMALWQLLKARGMMST